MFRQVGFRIWLLLLAQSRATICPGSSRRPSSISQQKLPAISGLLLQAAEELQQDWPSLNTQQLQQHLLRRGLSPDLSRDDAIMVLQGSDEKLKRLVSSELAPLPLLQVAIQVYILSSTASLYVLSSTASIVDLQDKLAPNELLTSAETKALLDQLLMLKRLDQSLYDSLARHIKVGHSQKYVTDLLTVQYPQARTLLQRLADTGQVQRLSLLSRLSALTALRLYSCTFTQIRTDRLPAPLSSCSATCPNCST